MLKINRIMDVANQYSQEQLMREGKYKQCAFVYDTS